MALRKTEDLILDVVEGSLRALATASWIDLEPRRPEFRISSFPVCGLLFAMDPGNPVSYYVSDFYFRHGTTEHELIQRAMPNSVAKHLVWGHWKCGACDSDGRNVIHKFCTKPRKKCSCGHRRWLYEEVTVEYHGLKGHVDMILQVPMTQTEKPSKRPTTFKLGKAGYQYIVCDFKTTNLPSGKQDGRAFSKYPVPTNVIQIGCYCAILTHMGLNVVGNALAYCDRSGPVRSTRNYHTVVKAWAKQDTDAYLARIYKAILARKPMLKARDAARDGKPLKTETVAALVKHRPCRTVEDHNEWSKAQFHYEDTSECPFKAVCCSKKLTDAQLTKRFKTKIPEGWVNSPWAGLNLKSEEPETIQ
jgi:hypothetical protein